MVYRAVSNKLDWFIHWLTHRTRHCDGLCIIAGLNNTDVTTVGDLYVAYWYSISFQLAGWHYKIYTSSCALRLNGYRSGLGSIYTKVDWMNCVRIMSMHALRLISQTGNRVWQ